MYITGQESCEHLWILVPDQGLGDPTWPDGKVPQGSSGVPPQDSLMWLVEQAPLQCLEKAELMAREALPSPLPLDSCLAVTMLLLSELKARPLAHGGRNHDDPRQVLCDLGRPVHLSRPWLCHSGTEGVTAAIHVPHCLLPTKVFQNPLCTSSTRSQGELPALPCGCRAQSSLPRSQTFPLC